MEDTNLYKEISKMYPYGEFPTKYIKKQKNTNLDNPRISNYYKDENFPKETTSQQNHTQQNNQTQKFDFNTILPLITALSSDKKDTSSILTTLLPIIAGNKAKEIGGILKLFTSKNQNNTKKQDNYIETNITSTDYKPIDSYEKI